MLDVRVADQAALRALLNLIWDTGTTVLSVILDRDEQSIAADPRRAREPTLLCQRIVRPPSLPCLLSG